MSETLHKCRVCQKRKPADAFHKDKTRSNGLCAKCKVCVREHMKERKSEIRDKIRELKKQPCVDCGNTYDPVCMDFDHLEEYDKSHGVSAMVSRSKAWPAIEAEIAKCELVCANCHRLRTKKRTDARIAAENAEHDLTE